MSKPTLNVPGVDPADIECHTSPDGRRWVTFKDRQVAFLNSDGPSFDGNWTTDSIRADCQKVMNACIDHWRATGRLFPEPPPKPVDCVCGGEAAVSDVHGGVWCRTSNCELSANTVDQWNIIQSALQVAKKQE